MAKRYEVLERSFINGKLHEPGSFVELEIDSPGSNLKEATAKELKESQPPTTGYAAARSAQGKFVIKDASGQIVGTFIGNKEDAEKEAERLNAGGAIA